MCGRYTLGVPAGDLVEAFDVPALEFDWLPRYNIAPGQLIPVLAEDRRGRRIGLLEWGFVPAWKDEPGRPMINARSETVASKPTFREGVRSPALPRPGRRLLRMARASAPTGSTRATDV